MAKLFQIQKVPVRASRTVALKALVVLFSTINLSLLSIPPSLASSTDCMESPRFNCDFSNKDLRTVNLSNLDLRNSDFSNSNLSGMNISNSNLSGSNFQYANMQGAALDDLTLDNVNFSYANFTNAKIENVYTGDSDAFITFKFGILDNTQFNHVFLKGAVFTSAKIRNSVFSGSAPGGMFGLADLTNSTFKYGSFIGAYFSGTKMKETSLTGISLCGANIENVDLSSTKLKRIQSANCSEMNEGVLLSKSNLPKKWHYYRPNPKSNRGYLLGPSAILDYADLNGFKIKNVDLSYASLRNSDLSNANLSQANLSHADISGSNLAYTNFRNANFYRIRYAWCDVSFPGIPAQSEYIETYFPKGWGWAPGCLIAGPGVDLSEMDFYYLRKCSAGSERCSYMGTGLRLDKIQIPGSNLRNTNLAQAYLYKANLARTDLRGANLNLVFLDGANLDGAFLGDESNGIKIVGKPFKLPKGWSVAKGILTKSKLK